jgi:hypothetical protein
MSPAFGVVVTDGAGFTVKVIVFTEFAPQLSVTVMVYTPAAAIVAVSDGFWVVAVKLFGPLHANVYGAPPPLGTELRVKVVLAQTVVPGVMFTELVKGEPALSVTVPLAAQPATEVAVAV